jgi:hypothetical protein
VVAAGGAAGEPPQGSRPSGGAGAPPPSLQAVYRAEEVLEAAECEALVRAAEALGRWRLASHTPFPTLDTHVDRLLDAWHHRRAATAAAAVGGGEAVLSERWLGQLLAERLYPLLRRLYRLRRGQELWLKELVVIKYEAPAAAGAAAPPEPAQAAVAGVAPHRDSSVLSFNVLLSVPAEYAGGGTAFPALRGGAGGELVLLEQGDAVLHGGKVLHEGRPVTRGRRYVLAGFVQVCRACAH